MFWKGRVSLSTQLIAFIKQKDVEFIDLKTNPDITKSLDLSCKISIGNLKDVAGICKLLNASFEQAGSRVQTAVTEEWLRRTFLDNAAIWIVAKDRMGTIRGCISSFRCKAPYKNSLDNTCSKFYPWGIVDWFCVHPLWRSKKIGSGLLETLDFITQKMGRKAHVFLKEGAPLPLPHTPVYATFLKCRKAGNEFLKEMRECSGLGVYLYHANDKETGLPLVRVEGLRNENASKREITEWEDAIDIQLPPCLVFVSGPDKVDISRGWKTDSLVSMYAFRWSAGKWLGTPPVIEIL